jgi:hypothetical protein
LSVLSRRFGAWQTLFGTYYFLATSCLLARFDGSEIGNWARVAGLLAPWRFAHFSRSRFTHQAPPIQLHFTAIQIPKIAHAIGLATQ